MSPLLLAALSAAELLTSVSEVRALTEDDYARNIPFCLTGLVTHASQNPFTGDRTSLLHTPSGDISLWCTNVVMHPGDVIRATGFTELNFFAQDQVLHTTNVVVLSHDRIPAPELLSQADLLTGKGDYRMIRVRGFFTDTFEDDIDGNYVISLFNVGGRIFHTATAKRPDTLAKMRTLIDADVELTGTCYPTIGGKRLFGGPTIHYNMAPDAIRVLTPPPSDPFQAPPLRFASRQLAETIAAMKRRSVRGRVLAAWQGRNALLTYDNGRIARLELSDGETPPRAGDVVDAIGFPATDLFNINLSNARIRPAQDGVSSTNAATSVSADRICHHPFTRRFDHDFHGQLVRLTGIVRSVPSADQTKERLAIDDLGILVPIDAGNSPETFAGIEIGSKVEVTGICVMESENWRPQRVVPIITGFFLVIRSPRDIVVLSRPPWWTPRRFMILVAVLLALLVAILVWNRVLQTVIRRKSHQLMREQLAKVRSELRVSERTNLAVELHDALSQNLTGLAFQLATAKSALAADPAALPRHLDTAERMLVSSRTELKRCLSDLRDNTLDETDFNVAIHRTLVPVMGNVTIDVDFPVSRQKLDDTTAHAILCIIRELTANAVMHGHATHLDVRGEIREGQLAFSVSDNGGGFDPESRPGLAEGHFGLDGIRERVEHLNGALSIDSAPRRGTCVTVSEIAL